MKTFDNVMEKFFIEYNGNEAWQFEVVSYKYNPTKHDQA